MVGDVMRPAGEARAHQYGAMQQIVQGGAVLVDPVKPTLKAPASQRFYLHYYVELLSSFAFNFNSRRYIKGSSGYAVPVA